MACHNTRRLGGLIISLASSETGGKRLESTSLIITLLLGAIGVFMLANELRLRRILQQRNLHFQEKQFEEEKKDREERREWLQRETVRTTQVSELLASNIATQLKGDVKWAFEALERAKLTPHAQTLFADRLGHFREEKEYLADCFIPLLLRRCKRLVESGHSVYLLIDSGTTLYPILDRLGRASVLCYENNEDWIKKLALITNNLVGIEALFESGIVNPHHRYSSLAVKCHLLPGVPLPIYSAVTGQETNDAIRRLRDNASNNTLFIGLTTGNWIRLRRSTPFCPVPLARGAGHLEFKQTLIDSSDEIYVVTPLGKIFVGIPPEAINVALGFSEGHPDPDKQPYVEVKISDEKAEYVNIVTTSRVHGRVLSELSTRVNALLDLNDQIIEQFPIASSTDKLHIAFPFDMLPEKRYLQIETEFPHPHTRREDFMREFFFASLSEPL